MNVNQKFERQSEAAKNTMEPLATTNKQQLKKSS